MICFTTVDFVTKARAVFPRRAVARAATARAAAPLVFAALLAAAAAPALAGPQHFGFGFGYLVTIEKNDAGQTALSVYEPPLHVKNVPWLLRWRDTSDQYKSVLSNSLAGNRSHPVQQ
jgi:hypothetical protein